MHLKWIEKLNLTIKETKSVDLSMLPVSFSLCYNVIGKCCFFIFQGDKYV